MSAAGLALGWIGFVRTYTCQPITNHSELEEEAPEGLRIWVDSRYRSRLAYFRLPVVRATLLDTEITLERHVLGHRSSPVIDVVLTCEGEDLPHELFDEYWRLMSGEISFAAGDHTCELQDLWDDAARMVIDDGLAATGGRTAFGCVALFTAANRVERPEDADAVVGTVGVQDGHAVWLERNRLKVIIRADDEAAAELRRCAWGYVLLATVCVHARHIAEHILDAIHEVAERCAPPLAASRAEDVLDQAAAIQRTAVLTRPLSHATNYLGHPALVGAFEDSALTAALGQGDREHLDAALDGLDKLVNGISASAATRSQRRLNAVGFVLALLGVLIGSTNIVTMVRGRVVEDAWVFVAWGVVLVATGVTLIRTRPFRGRAGHG